MNTFSAEQLGRILSEHKLWLAGDGGTRAVLTGAVLTGAVLTGAVLRDADLTGADLTGAVLTDAVLRDADLTGAVLTDAVLTGAVLTGAVLRDAVLTGAVLTDADLTDAVLTGAVLRGAVLTDAVLRDVPVVPDLDRKILDDLDAGKYHLRMNAWHTCQTTHCRAGLAIMEAGKAGRALESEVGSAIAGALIYHASTGRIPNFYASDADALADIRECANKR